MNKILLIHVAISRHARYNTDINETKGIRIWAKQRNERNTEPG